MGLKGLVGLCPSYVSPLPTAILSELLQRENRVLHFWTLKKRRLDQCQQYVVFERSAKQVVQSFPWLYLSSGEHTEAQYQGLVQKRATAANWGWEWGIKRKESRVSLVSNSAFTKLSVLSLVTGDMRKC